MAYWEPLLGMVSGEVDPGPEFPPYRLLAALAEHGAHPLATPPAFLETLPAAELGLAPLHVAHGHVYAFFKFVLFEESVLLRGRFGAAGVVGVLFAMAAIVERSLGPDTASEERRVLGYWLAKEAQARLDAKLGDEKRVRWEQVRDDGYRQWKNGMQNLYGREQ